MEIKQKLSFLSVVFATVLLAGCAGNEEVAGGGSTAGGSGVDSTSAPAVTETVDANAAALAAISTVYYFDFDEATLTAESRASLDAAAPALKAAGVSVRLEGHADERGTPEYNLALGERRAQAVANYLGLQGVDAAKLEVISYGEEKPVMTGSDEASWAKNRRVELVK
jgi:peptidoglycan-associated lipoprotein